MEGFVERRRQRRHELALVMEIEATASGKTPSRLNVLTSNIAAGGVFFKTARWNDLPVGGGIRFSIFLPTEMAKQSWHVSRLDGSGTVLRHQDVGGSGSGESERWRGVAVKFDEALKIF